MCYKWQDCLLSHGLKILLNISRLFYLFIHLQTLRLCPHFGYNKKCYINMCSLRMQISFDIIFSLLLDIYSDVGLLDDMIIPSLGTSMQFSTAVGLIYSPANSAQRFPFLCILHSACYFLLLNDSYSSRCEVISYWGFNLIFPDDW